MKRYHLFEIEDQVWCPAVVRQTVVDTLRFAINVFGFYRATSHLLKRALRCSNSTRIVDLCAGAGGPWKSLHKEINSNGDSFSIYLTDLHPNNEALSQLQEESQNQVQYCPDSVSALKISPELTGFRTLFTSFHHFEPQQAQQIIADSVNCRQGIAIFEFTRRHPLAILGMIMAVLGPLVFVPFMRPFHWSRIMATYVVPIIPLTACYDGIVSCLRSYTADELQAFTEPFADQGYEWEIGTLRAGMSPVPLTYLIGYPAAVQE